MIQQITLKINITSLCPIKEILDIFEISYLPPREGFQKISELYIWQHGIPAKEIQKQEMSLEFVCSKQNKEKKLSSFHLKMTKVFQDFT